MSPFAAAWCVLLLIGARQDARAACTPAAAAALEAAGRSAIVGAYPAATDALRLAVTSDAACLPLTVAAWSSRAWLVAVEAANAGGTPASLVDVRQAIDLLETLGGPVSPAAYAAAVLHAAAAAAQDERDEMALWLDHARDLTRHPALAGAPPRWPLPIDFAEGELWLSVDDYEVAELAYAKVLAREESPAAWFGLARARAARGDAEGACHAYRRVDRMGIASDALAAAAARAIERCPR